MGKKILLSKHNLSRLLDRLEANGLLQRCACEEDGRGNRVKITTEGEKTLKKMWLVYSKTMQECFGDKFTMKEFEQLVSILNKV